MITVAARAAAMVMRGGATAPGVGTSAGRAVSAMAIRGARGGERCGKKQYKSRECKARSIAKNVAARGTGSSREMAHVDWLTSVG